VLDGDVGAVSKPFVVCLASALRSSQKLGRKTPYRLQDGASKYRGIFAKVMPMGKKQTSARDIGI